MTRTSDVVRYVRACVSSGLAPTPAGFRRWRAVSRRLAEADFDTLHRELSHRLQLLTEAVSVSREALRDLAEKTRELDEGDGG